MRTGSSQLCYTHTHIHTHTHTHTLLPRHAASSMRPLLPTTCSICSKLFNCMVHVLRWVATSLPQLAFSYCMCGPMSVCSPAAILVLFCYGDSCNNTHCSIFFTRIYMYLLLLLRKESFLSFTTATMPSVSSPEPATLSSIKWQDWERCEDHKAIVHEVSWIGPVRVSCSFGLVQHTNQGPWDQSSLEVSGSSLQDIATHDWVTPSPPVPNRRGHSYTQFPETVSWHLLQPPGQPPNPIAPGEIVRMWLPGQTSWSAGVCTGLWAQEAMMSKWERDTINKITGSLSMPMSHPSGTLKMTWNSHRCLTQTAQCKAKRIWPRQENQRQHPQQIRQPCEDQHKPTSP